jgi:hypothetical protein
VVEKEVNNGWMELVNKDFLKKPADASMNRGGRARFKLLDDNPELFSYGGIM